jgi:nucleoside recognition membrane protein YjiH
MNVLEGVLMEIDIEQLISALVILAGIAGGLFANRKYQTLKTQLLETVGDLADFLALVGPSVAAILTQKSSLAEAIKSANAGAGK